MSSSLATLWDALGNHACVLVLTGICFLYYLGSTVYRSIRITRRDKSKKAVEGEGVSVILTSNNRAEELKKNLEYYLQQDYPEFEVIVVDECSEDETQEVLAGFQQRYPRLRTTRIFPETKFRSTKKLAINIGILAARYDILLFSEIDSRPANTGWIRSMQAYFTPDTAVVVGYANYAVSGKGNIIRRGLRFLRFLKMLLLIKSGCYVLGNGRNMGYRKQFYIAKRGFSKNSQSYLGYDNEMVKTLSELGKVKINKEQASFITINDENNKTWREDSAYYYINKRKWPFAACLKADTNSSIRFLLYFLFIFLIFKQIFWKYVIVCILLTFIIDFITINVYLKHLKQRKLFLISLFVNSIGFIYSGYYNVYSIFTRKKWR